MAQINPEKRTKDGCHKRHSFKLTYRHRRGRGAFKSLSLERGGRPVGGTRRVWRQKPMGHGAFVGSHHGPGSFTNLGSGALSTHLRVQGSGKRVGVGGSFS